MSGVSKVISKTEILQWIEKKADPVGMRDLAGGGVKLKGSGLMFDWLPDVGTKTHQMRVDMHGGGPSGFYGLFNDDSSEGAQQMSFTGVHGFGKAFPEQLNHIKGKDIDKVFSIACNADGGGNPEFYEKLLGKDLKEVIMTPKGSYGVSGQQMTNAVTHTANTIADIIGLPGPRGANQHVFQRVDDHLLGFIPFGHHFQDVGVYHTPFDEGVHKFGLPIAGAIGIGALAYALYKKKKNSGKLNSIKNQVVHGKSK